MNKLQNTDIARRIHAAIRPQLARADHAIWELQTPKFWKGRHDPEHPRFETP